MFFKYIYESELMTGFVGKRGKLYWSAWNVARLVGYGHPKDFAESLAPVQARDVACDPSKFHPFSGIVRLFPHGEMLEILERADWNISLDRLKAFLRQVENLSTRVVEVAPHHLHVSGEEGQPFYMWLAHFTSCLLEGVGLMEPLVCIESLEELSTDEFLRQYLGEPSQPIPMTDDVGVWMFGNPPHHIFLKYEGSLMEYILTNTMRIPHFFASDDLPTLEERGKKKLLSDYPVVAFVGLARRDRISRFLKTRDRIWFCERELFLDHPVIAGAKQKAALPETRDRMFFVNAYIYTRDHPCRVKMFFKLEVFQHDARFILGFIGQNRMAYFRAQDVAIIMGYRYPHHYARANASGRLRDFVGTDLGLGVRLEKSWAVDYPRLLDLVETAIPELFNLLKGTEWGVFCSFERVTTDPRIAPVVVRFSKESFLARPFEEWVKSFSDQVMLELYNLPFFDESSNETEYFRQLRYSPLQNDHSQNAACSRYSPALQTAEDHTQNATCSRYSPTLQNAEDYSQNAAPPKQIIFVWGGKEFKYSLNT